MPYKEKEIEKKYYTIGFQEESWEGGWIKEWLGGMQ